ncbi:MAG: STAS domain-containing protein, partial [Treponema sp.]|nr:STAS domain-containing protein [Treponema sp.]
MELAEGKFEDGTFTAKLNGHIDSANASNAEAALKELTAGKDIKAFVIDAENLDYISSAGLRVVLGFRKLYPNFKLVN